MPNSLLAGLIICFWLHIKLNEPLGLVLTTEFHLTVLCYYAILEQCESPLLKLEAQTKTRAATGPDVKSFYEIPNVIQPDPTNKDLLYFTQTQSESL